MTSPAFRWVPWKSHFDKGSITNKEVLQPFGSQTGSVPGHCLQVTVGQEEPLIQGFYSEATNRMTSRMLSRDEFRSFPLWNFVLLKHFWGWRCRSACFTHKLSVSSVVVRRDQYEKLWICRFLIYLPEGESVMIRHWEELQYNDEYLSLKVTGNGVCYSEAVTGMIMTSVR